MQKFTMKGRILEIGEEQTFGSFTKRQAVVDNSTGQYPSPVQVLFKKDKASLLDGVNPGDEVEVEFTVDGRRWDGPNGVRYFTDLTAWSLKVASSAQAAEPESCEATGKGALNAYLASGGVKSDFALFARQVTGKQDSKSYTAADWAMVIAKAKAPKAVEEPSDPDDMPF